MRALLNGILRSFSVQLLLLHLRSNFLLLFVWALFLLMISGLLGPNLGLQYLFLDPEYLGRTSFTSFLLVGMAFGLFTMSWNLSTYLLIGGYFNFLASLSRPFFKFCINNALLPLGVFCFYCGLLVWFLQPSRLMLNDRWLVAESISGLILGLVLSLFSYAIYFNLTNRDIAYYQPKFREPPPNMGPGQGRRTSGYRPYRAKPLAPILTGLYDNPYQVQTYLNEKLRTKLVRSVSHYDSQLLQSIFRQNHANALLIQFLTILGLLLLGLLIDQPLFQIPAGASFLILLSLVISIIGAISYWFSEWRSTLLILLLAAINFLTSGPLVRRGNEAYGLDYEERVTYNEDKLQSLYASDQLALDLATTEGILEAWKARQPEEKPPLVIVCASGGGLTAALWATHVAQTLEEQSQGQFLRRTALMTGASGGQLGLAFVREAYLSALDFSEGNNLRLDQISKDILNPLAFSIVSNDLFLPYRSFQVGSKTYRRDRAYSFEEEFIQNTGLGLDKPLWRYRQPELAAEVPMMFLTPSIVEDGRRMVISPHGVSYMTAPPLALSGDLPLLPDMVDFRWLLQDQDADSLRFSTALRMNATYPYVLPLVQLPTKPVIRLMDAGYRDNYGIVSAVRFVSTFEEWIKENTSGVHLIQISAFREREDPPSMEEDRPGLIESLFDPVGVAGNILSVQILDQEVLIGQLAQRLGTDFF
ncbi:MAG: patatin-like phospholipase family protein, partial [Bacteroidota bacterium]